MSELSPEPWVVDEGGHYVVDGRGEVICTMDKLEVIEGRWCPSAETLANADLFAAAPETKDQLAELVAAAEPFADLVYVFDADQPDSAMTIPISFAYGQIRALAAAVAAAKGE